MYYAMLRSASLDLTPRDLTRPVVPTQALKAQMQDQIRQAKDQVLIGTVGVRRVVDCRRCSIMLVGF